MGTAIADGEDRAVDAARRAISSPLLEDASIEGARGVLINITGGTSLGIARSTRPRRLSKAAHPDANIIFGAVVDPSLEDRVKITVIATGFGDEQSGRDGRTGADTPVAMEKLPDLVQEHRQSQAARESGAVTPSLSMRRWLVRYSRSGARRRRRRTRRTRPADAADADDTTPFDVPAFLRRQQG